MRPAELLLYTSFSSTSTPHLDVVKLVCPKMPFDILTVRSPGPKWSQRGICMSFCGPEVRNSLGVCCSLINNPSGRRLPRLIIRVDVQVDHFRGRGTAAGTHRSRVRRMPSVCYRLSPIKTILAVQINEISLPEVFGLQLRCSY